MGGKHPNARERQKEIHRCFMKQSLTSSFRFVVFDQPNGVGHSQCR